MLNTTGHRTHPNIFYNQALPKNTQLHTPFIFHWTFGIESRTRTALAHSLNGSCSKLSFWILITQTQKSSEIPELATTKLDLKNNREFLHTLLKTVLNTEAQGSWSEGCDFESEYCQAITVGPLSNTLCSIYSRYPQGCTYKLLTDVHCFTHLISLHHAEDFLYSVGVGMSGCMALHPDQCCMWAGEDRARCVCTCWEVAHIGWRTWGAKGKVILKHVVQVSRYYTIYFPIFVAL